MEPLFDAQEEFGDAEVDLDMLERAVEEGWLDRDASPDELYSGHNVEWIGRPGHMLRVEWDQVQTTHLNPFVSRKVATFARMMSDPNINVVAKAPPAMVTSVSLDDVAESQKAEADDELLASYGMTRPFSSGDDELDEYLAGPETFLEYYAADEDDADVITADMTVRSEEAISKCEGDLGNIVVYLRDGNHRAMAAQLSGEPDLWVDVRWMSQKELDFVGLRKEDFE